MDRGTRGFAVASALFVVSLSCEMAVAAEPGFYIGAAGGRSEQRLDKQAGVGGLPVAVIGLLPPGGPIPAIPSIRPVPGATLPPIYNLIAIPMTVTDRAADETDVGWNVALGYRVNKYLAAELSYVSAGEASLTERYSAPLPPTIPAPDIRHTYTVNSRGPTVTLLGSLPLSERWEVFLRGGVLFAKQEVKMRITSDNPRDINPRPIERDFSDEVFTLGAGVQWAFLPRWTARLEYQRTDDLQSNEIMGESRLDQASLSVLFGL